MDKGRGLQSSTLSGDQLKGPWQEPRQNEVARIGCGCRRFLMSIPAHLAPHIAWIRYSQKIVESPTDYKRNQYDGDSLPPIAVPWLRGIFHRTCLAVPAIRVSEFESYLRLAALLPAILGPLIACLRTQFDNCTAFHLLIRLHYQPVSTIVSQAAISPSVGYERTRGISPRPISVSPASATTVTLTWWTIMPGSTTIYLIFSQISAWNSLQVPK